jgi:hypothetical protein
MFAVVLAIFENGCLVAIATGMHYRKCLYDDDCNLGTVCVYVARCATRLASMREPAPPPRVRTRHTSRGGTRAQVLSLPRRLAEAGCVHRLRYDSGFVGQF